MQLITLLFSTRGGSRGTAGQRMLIGGRTPIAQEAMAVRAVGRSVAHIVEHIPAASARHSIANIADWTGPQSHVHACVRDLISGSRVIDPFCNVSIRVVGGINVCPLLQGTVCCVHTTHRKGVITGVAHCIDFCKLLLR